MKIQPCDFSIKYIPGPKIPMADALSRVSPHEKIEIKGLDVTIHELTPTMSRVQVETIQKATQEDTTLLCNPNFVYKRILVFQSGLYIFPLPTYIFTKDSKTGSACFHRAELDLCFVTMCWSSFVFFGNKRGMLAKLYMRWTGEGEVVCSKASLTLETIREQKTANTRHR